MKFQPTRIYAAVLLALCLLFTSETLRADRLELNDGSKHDGTIKKMENGEVTIHTGGKDKVFSMQQVVRMQFDLPRKKDSGSRSSLDSFFGNSEAQEIASHLDETDASTIEMNRLIDEIKREWVDRKSIPASEAPKWTATRTRFNQALERHQEILDSLYYHMLLRLEDYNQLTIDAERIYVGVQGPFHIGSALLSREMQESHLRKYMPSNWYDTIFRLGYNSGLREGEERRTRYPSD
jgi:hypothetical protein